MSGTILCSFNPYTTAARVCIIDSHLLMRTQGQEGESVFPDQIFSRLAEGLEFNSRQSGPSFTWLAFKSCCFVPYRLGNRRHVTWPMVCKCLTLKAALMFGFGHSENKLWTS